MLQEGREGLDKEVSALRGELRAERTRSETAETGKTKVGVASWWAWLVVVRLFSIPKSQALL